jgi:hypothetical protein
MYTQSPLIPLTVARNYVHANQFYIRTKLNIDRFVNKNIFRFLNQAWVRHW